MASGFQQGQPVALVAQRRFHRGQHLGSYALATARLGHDHALDLAVGQSERVGIASHASEGPRAHRL